MPAAAVKKRCKKRLTSRTVSRLMVRRARKRRRTESSGLERKVLGWLDNAGIAYQGQYAIGRCHFDALIEPDLVLEINGCYWHRYKHLLTCRYKLMLLWECDVEADGEAKTIAKIRLRIAEG